MPSNNAQPRGPLRSFWVVLLTLALLTALTIRPAEGEVIAGEVDLSITVLQNAPDAITFDPVTASGSGALTLSATRTLTGFPDPLPVSVSGEGAPQYRINGGAWVSAAGTVIAGDTIAMRLTSGAWSATRTATLLVGETPFEFRVTTPSFTSQTFAYTGTVQTFTAPVSGTYKLTALGAQGGAGSRAGGLGGSATGNVVLTAGETLYVYVGGAGGQRRTAGWNGGGIGGSGTSLTQGGGGGGASDIRRNGTALSNRIIVAGGGGGGAGGRCCTFDKYYRGTGGGGGGGGYFGGGGSGAADPDTNTTCSAATTAGTNGFLGSGGAGGNAGGTSCSSPFAGSANPPGSGGSGGGLSGLAGSKGSSISYPGGGGTQTTGGAGTQKLSRTAASSGGGGGSSFVGGLSVGSTSAGVRSGNGQIQIQLLGP